MKLFEFLVLEISHRAQLSFDDYDERQLIGFCQTPPELGLGDMKPKRNIY